MSAIADLEQVRGIINKQFKGKREVSTTLASAGDDNGTQQTATATGNGDTATTTPTAATATTFSAAAATTNGDDCVVVVSGGGLKPQSLDVGGGGGSGGGGLDQLSATLIKLSSDWCFVDSCTAERFFRVDRAQEHLHYLTDIANESLYVLDQDSPTMPPTPEDELLVQSALLQHQQLQQQNISPSESR